MASKTVQPRQPTREGQVLKREDERIRERADSQILDGRLTDVEVISPTSSTKFKHGLNRKPNGYLIARCKATVALTAPIRELAMNDQFIELRNDSANSVFVALWVF